MNTENQPTPEPDTGGEVELAEHILHGLTNDWELVAFIREESAQPWRDALCQARAVLASDWLAALLSDAEQRGRAQGARDALLAAADELVWVRPKVCPCTNPEACCGSESSCDAMRPHSKVVGEQWLRDRATSLARQEPTSAEGAGS